MKENNIKGFTLIELLAIIVILAIIAVITVPIILNVIENARKGSAIDSAYGYRDAVGKYYVTKLGLDSDFKLDGYYDINSNGIITKGGEEHHIDYLGTDPDGGFLSIVNGNVNDACIEISGYRIKIEDGLVSSTEKGFCKAMDIVGTPQVDGELTVGDEIRIGSEHFYVISSNQNTTALLAKYSLYVGKIYSKTTYEVIKNIESTDDGYCLQSPTAKGSVHDSNQIVASVPFSQTDYWNDVGDNGYRILKEKYNIGDSDYEANIYDSDYVVESGDNYSIAYYVEQYVSKLIELGAPDSISGRLLIWTEFFDLKDIPSVYIFNGTTYWLATPYIYDVLTIDFGMGTSPYNSGTSNSVRPVVEIDTEEIKKLIFED